MKNSLNKSQIERFSRQLILKNIGAKGQKKILSSKVLVVGIGGLGCPAAENLVRAAIDQSLDEEYNVQRVRRLQSLIQDTYAEKRRQVDYF